MNNEILSNFVKSIADIAAKQVDLLKEVKLGDRTLVLRRTDGAIVAEHQPKAEHWKPAFNLLDTASLLQWTQNIAPEPGMILVSRTDPARAYAGPIYGNPDVRHASKAFYADFLPSPRMFADAWLDWWDRISYTVPNDVKDRVNTAVSSIGAVSGKAVTVNQSGAMIAVQINSENGVKTAAPLPKRIIARIPFGDPNHTTEVCFVLRVGVENDKVVFQTNVDQAFEGMDPYGKYQSWVCEQLKPAVESGWTVLRT